MRRLLLAIPLTAGCAVRQPIRCQPYSWGTICKSDQQTVNEHCTPDGDSTFDSGKPRPKHAPVEGCANIETRTILVPDTDVGAKAITHEAAHLDGHAQPGADGYDWENWTEIKDASER